MTRASAPNPTYAELQVTSNFSFLRGGSHAEELVATAKALSLSAIAITDRNTLAGVVRAHIAAKEANIRLIVGARLDLTDAPSLLCLPTDREAYARLTELLTLGQRRAGKGQCLLSLADVAAHAEGQIFIALPPDDWSPCEMTPTRVSDAVKTPARVLTFPAQRSARKDQREDPANEDAAEKKCGEGVPELAVDASPSPAPLDDTASGRERPSQTNVTSADAPTIAQSAEERKKNSPAFENALARVQAAIDAPLHLAAAHLFRGDDRRRIAALAEISARCGTPLVATGDILYHARHRRPLQDVLTAIREKCTVSAAGFRLEANAERHLKTPAEMARLFKGHEDAVARSARIAARCRFSLDELVYEYPDEPVPEGKTPQGHLEDLTWEGAKWRFPDGIPPAIGETIQRELELIARLAYAPYFLTVHDIVTFARSRGILCQGRGSAANSVVCYCLGITGVNPAEIDLLFERFITPERQEPPDIDVDFEHERREEVIQYIYARYGRERAGLAATVISYRARSAVREVGKAMGLSEDTLSALAGMVWGTRSGGVLPEKHVREAGLDPADPLLARVLALAGELAGFPRHLSQHVGGFVLTRRRLSEIVPIGNAAMEARTAIEWDKDDLDAVGLLKVDVLGLGMLTCIRRSFEFLAAHYGVKLTLGSVPRDDPAVYDMLCRADSVGVFQVESRAQMNMLPRLKPRCFYDLVIEVAIVRPGPIQGDMVHPYLRRRSGEEAEEYPAPDPAFGPPDELRRILGKTKGVPLFQEQAMKIAMVAAEFTADEVNQLRRAMATFRRRGTIGLLEEKMVARMVARGYSADFSQRCFNQIKGFGEYGFPESHAASFAHLVYVSSWIKCHYPAVFAAALLNAQPMGFYAPAQIVRDAREHGVEVREADAGASDWDATLEPGRRPGSFALRLGLRQIDGLREDDAQRIVAVRGEWMSAVLDSPCAGGRHVPSPRLRGEGQGEGQKRVKVLAAAPHPDPLPVPLSLHGEREASGVTLDDIRRRARVPVATLERLAAADAFRSLGLDRRQALWEVRALANAPALPLFAHAEAAEAGGESEVRLPEMPLGEHVVNDYQTLRLSLKAHPMSLLRARFEAMRTLDAARLKALPSGARVALAGIVLVRQRPGSAKGVVFMTLEDESGVANSVIWPKVLERYRRVVMAARLVLIKGVVQRHEDIIHIVAQHLEDLSADLMLLSEAASGMRVPIARADEVLRPEPGSARGAAEAPSHPRFARHPRDARVIPKSRDFH